MIPFYKLSIPERRKWLVDHQLISQVQSEQYAKDYSLTHTQLSHFSENVISQLAFPLGVLKEIKVNNNSYMVPMTTEEPSVVAAANHGAKLMLKNGITATSYRTGIYGQVVLDGVSLQQTSQIDNDLNQAKKDLMTQFSSLVNYGGGIETIELITENKPFLEIRFKVNPAQAMGANKANAILEAYSQRLKTQFGLDSEFAILSNAPAQFVTAKAMIDFETLTKGSISGEKIAHKIARMSDFAQVNNYRAVTHNKGIMNGVDAVLLATGNDFRAVEASVHMHAASTGYYSALSQWQVINQQLVGQITLPMPIGVVGGSISSRQLIKNNYDLMANPSAEQLSEIIAGVGLANNLAALYALTTDGIQKGHMKLQLQNMLLSLGASESQIPKLIEKMQQDKNYQQDYAKQLLKEMRN
ncbi:hydroxymethylglutaryl-CoA reductase, degradative [Holzapfeliella floricola]|uniref:3-hydroxy-3-methylglutaryl coenzyme A reductase n=1 Tax=Holzapfeliella floricola DSM 23037 = JCM 16512 TaxID=1423744 RepID=A0A0R2DU69_9LACO|nr:hydroxymethylglutaryl-CoA reductase, degradative [Holzapfeliella floricola]KRN04487.1 hydroxymethylglutaryl-CoA reductase [Holzapfeliella floricola DSM 23037 = JCM 16512]